MGFLIRRVDKKTGITIFPPPTYFIYVFGDPCGLKKIGCTGYPKKRIQALSSQFKGCVLYGLNPIERIAARNAELEVHRLLLSYRVHGEWFNASLDQINEAIKEAFYTVRAEIVHEMRGHPFDYKARKARDYRSPAQKACKGRRRIKKSKELNEAIGFWSSHKDLPQPPAPEQPK